MAIAEDKAVTGVSPDTSLILRRIKNVLASMQPHIDG